MHTSIPEIIANKNDTYHGDLKHYFRILFLQARSNNNDYHNIRHPLHVLWNCYQGAIFHQLEPRDMRNILIAALFHDFNHSGIISGDDDLEIIRALRALQKYLLPQDKPHESDIVNLIKATQYPYVVSEADLTLSTRILRDADMSQTFSEAWIQQVIFGLARERNVDPHNMLEGQADFLRDLTFFSQWGQETFAPLLPQKLLEVEAYLSFLHD